MTGVSEQTKTPVASRAEDAAHMAGLVVVVDLPVSSELLGANAAPTALVSQQVVELFPRHAVRETPAMVLRHASAGRVPILANSAPAAPSLPGGFQADRPARGADALSSYLIDLAQTMEPSTHRPSVAMEPREWGLFLNHLKRRLQ